MLVAVDISPSVHRSLVERAERDGMALSDWLVDLLLKQTSDPSLPHLVEEGPGNASVDTHRMTPGDARAIEHSVAFMDACSLLEDPIEPIS